MLVLACLSLREQRPARRRAGLSLAAAGTVLFAVSPQWWFPSAGLHWAWWEQLAGSSYVVLAVTVLLAAAYPARRRPLPPPDDPASARLAPDGHGRSHPALLRLTPVLPAAPR
jgi:hypothetical protein